MGITAEAARVNVGMTQAEVAEMLGLGRKAYGRREKNPETLTLEQMDMLCDVLWVDYERGRGFTPRAPRADCAASNASM